MKQIYLILAFSLFTLSCGQNSQDKSVGSKEDLDEFKSFQLAIDGKEVSLFDLIEEVEIMRLEETDEALLSNIHRVQNHGDKLIFPDGRDGNLFIYDQSGKFVRRINRQGEGPEEYAGIQNFWLDPENRLVIYDNVSKVLHRYDLNGNYLDEKKLSPPATNVHPFNGGLALDRSLRMTGDSLKFNVFFLNANMDVSDMYNAYKHHVPFPISSTVSTFNSYKDGVLFKQVFSDTVHYLRENGMTPLMKFDFGDKYLWSDEEIYSNGASAMNSINQKGQVWIFSPKVGEEKIFLFYNTSFEDSGQMIVDRRTGNAVKVSFQKNQEEDFTPSAISWLGDRLLFSLSSSDVADFTDNLGEDRWKLRQGSSLQEIESSENPVLMWVKFKPGLAD